VILNLTASFQEKAEGLAHQLLSMPQVTPPEALEEDFLRRRRLVEQGSLDLIPHLLIPSPIDWRSVELEERFDNKRHQAIYHSWFRTKARLPDDPRVHRAVLAYASDMLLLDTATMPHSTSLGSPDIIAATIDHSVWFHAPFRADEWLLFCSDSPWAGSARGFTRGSIFTRDGRLVASIAQEGLLRIKSCEGPAGACEKEKVESGPV